MYANNWDVLVTIFVDKDLPNVGFPYILFTGTTKDREESLKQIMLSFRHCPNYLSSPISGKLVHKCCTLVLKYLLRQPYFKSEVKKWPSDAWAMLSTQYLLTCDKKRNGHEVCGAAHMSLWKSKNNMGSSCEFAFCPLFVSARSRAGVLTMIRLIK